jgi:Zn-dependent M32 family carboxypeptidase
MDSSGNDKTKVLKEIEKLMLESQKLDVEGLRRQQVAQMKFYGWLIEWIESQRDKLRQKGKIDHWIALFQKITDLRTQVMIEYVSMPRYGIEHMLEESRMRSSVQKMTEIYGTLKRELVELLQEEESRHYDFPEIEKSTDNSMSRLSELNVCLGQLLGHVFSKLYGYIS